MRDIDPIRNPSEALLSAALNRLAKGSARQAPASVGAQLALEFRRHHQRRRRARAVVMLSLAACLILAITLLLTLQQPAQNAPSLVREPVPAVTPDPAARTASSEPSREPKRTSRQDQRGARDVASSPSQNEFMPLGTYDPAMVPGELEVVRLELTGADLRLVGAPVAEDLADRRMLADVVVASDGTPYAVRLVR
jgi:hypothetical protein